ncbi:MAG: hypothetical protein M3Q66_11325, partial [Chloroflexota bacterium]|nr:hypothetical protein [Chloroflexota bacterium]
IERAARLATAAGFTPAQIRELGASLAAMNQRTAQATVDALAEAGLLLMQPAVVATIKHVLRDDDGRITGILERLEQVVIRSPDEIGGDPPEAA